MHDCGFEFLDQEAEKLRTEAVEQRRKEITAEELKALRQKYGWSQAELGWWTGWGEATIARWERGELIPNVANRRYLRLLAALPENVELLRSFQESGSPLPSVFAFRDPRTEEREAPGKKFALRQKAS